MVDNREYGLVLAGGGTKGAYQVGVWKALKELNINIKGIVGASIGSLNGALFLQDDFKMVEDMYENIKLGNIMNVDGMNENKNIFSLSNIFNLAADYTKQKGIDNTPLRNMIKKYIDMDKIYNSNIDFGLVTFSVKNRQPLQVFKNEIPKEEMENYLLASSCFPIFKPQIINNEEYFDGGLYDNIPANMLIEKGYKVGLFRPITVFPFPEVQIAELAGRKEVKRFFVTELSKGQMVEDVRLAVNGRKPVEFFGRNGGNVMTAEELMNEIIKGE